jgi:hypothetical protein
MAYTPMGVPFKLTAEESGSMAPNYAENLMKGFQLGMIPRQMADQLLSSKLANKIKETQAKYEEEKIKTDLSSKLAQQEHWKAQTGLTNAQTGNIPYQRRLIEAQIAHQRRLANAPQQLKGELANLYALRNSFSEGSPERVQVDEAIKNKVSGSQGITIGKDPVTGEQFVQIGGTQKSGQTGDALKTFEKTGEITSPPTRPMILNLQKRIAGLRTAKGFFEDIKQLGKFQTVGSKLSKEAKSFSNFILNTNFSEPSEGAAGKAAIVGASEGLISAFGLNATGANRKALEQILQPTFGESKKGYEDRIDRQLAEYIANQNFAETSLRRGIPVGNVNQQGAGENNPTTYTQADIEAAKAELARRMQQGAQ